MKEELKKGTIVRKSFTSNNIIKLTEDGTGKSYYFYQLNSETAFPVGTAVQFTLASFSDGNPPIVIEVKKPL